MASKLKHEKHRKPALPDHKSEAVPQNWPEDIAYLRDQTYSAAVTLELRSKLSRTPSDNINWLKLQSEFIQIPCPWVDIITIDEASHPAHGQRGLFAKSHLLPDSFICK